MNRFTLITLALLGASLFGTYHYYGEVSGLQEQVTNLGKEVKAANAKTDAIREEYNELQAKYDSNSRKNGASQAATEAARSEHRRSGTITRASESDARLLEQRSREVRGDPALPSGKPN